MLVLAAFKPQIKIWTIWIIGRVQSIADIRNDMDGKTGVFFFVQYVRTLNDPKCARFPDVSQARTHHTRFTGWTWPPNIRILLYDYYWYYFCLDRQSKYNEIYAFEVPTYSIRLFIQFSAFRHECNRMGGNRKIMVCRMVCFAIGGRTKTIYKKKY